MNHKEVFVSFENNIISIEIILDETICNVTRYYSLQIMYCQCGNTKLLVLWF